MGKNLLQLPKDKSTLKWDFFIHNAAMHSMQSIVTYVQ